MSDGTLETRICQDRTCCCWMWRHWHWALRQSFVSTDAMMTWCLWWLSPQYASNTLRTEPERSLQLKYHNPGQTRDSFILTVVSLTVDSRFRLWDSCNHGLQGVIFLSFGFIKQCCHLFSLVMYSSDALGIFPRSVSKIDGFKIKKTRDFPWNLVRCEILKVAVEIQIQAPNRCPQCVVYCQPAWRWVVWWPSWSHATRWSLA